MTGPWERFQQPKVAGPWQRYQPAMSMDAGETRTFVDDIGIENVDLMPEEASPARVIEKPMVRQGKPSLAKTVFDQGMQGASFGFADEVSDPLGAIVATAMRNPKALINKDAMFNDPALAQELSNARQSTQTQLNSELSQRPVASIAANLAGGLATGGVGGTTKAGASLANSLRTGNLATRAAKGAVAGAASGGLFGYGSGEDGDRLSSAGTGALYGAAIGGAIPVAARGLNKLNSKTIIPSSDDIKKLAQQKYTYADQVGGKLKPEFTNSFVDLVQGMRPQTSIGRAVGGDSELTKLADKLETVRNQPMTLQAAQEVDELLGDAVDGFYKDGKLAKEGKKLLDVQTSLREEIENAGESAVEGGKQGFDALKDGRKLWSASQRMRDIERIINRAEDYQVPATAIKTGFRTLKNSSRYRGYSAAEKAAIDRAAKTGIATDILSVFGSRLGPLAAGAVGGTVGAAGGPLGALAGAATTGLIGHAASSASRAGAYALQKGRAVGATKAISDRAGLTKSSSRIPLDFEKYLRLPNK